MTIKGLLFDLDGVLLDSERWHQRLNVRCINDLGWDDFDPRLFYYTVGAGKGMDPWDRILSEAPIKYRNVETKKIFQEYKQSLYDWVPFTEVIFPEVKRVLRHLSQAGYKLACCSSSRQEYIDKALCDCNIRRYFDVVVTGHDFTRSKPDPEIYLYAMKKLCLTVEECLVIEDSLYGIKAGKNAAMKVAARKDHDFGFDQSMADYLFEDLSELMKIIKH